MTVYVPNPLGVQVHEGQVCILEWDKHLAKFDALLLAAWLVYRVGDDAKFQKLLAEIRDA
jgi:hypothetical protein